MIKSAAEVIMGSGDVRVDGGMVDDPRNTIGAVFFSSQDPKPIGDEGEVDIDNCLCEDYKVSLTFSKVESIDVVIAQLNVAKELMIKEQEG